MYDYVTHDSTPETSRPNAYVEVKPSKIILSPDRRREDALTKYKVGYRVPYIFCTEHFTYVC